MEILLRIHPTTEHQVGRETEHSYSSRGRGWPNGKEEEGRAGGIFVYDILVLVITIFSEYKSLALGTWVVVPGAVNFVLLRWGGGGSIFSYVCISTGLRTT
jgi:hypothetical protein